jgi:AsmA protein
MLKKIALGVGVLVALLVIVALIAPFVIPVDWMKTALAERVKAATGRDLRIEGPVRLSLLPTLGVSAEKVAFANAPGAASPDMARLAKLQLELKLWPLLARDIVVDRFVLTEPVIALEVDERGKPNWAFDAPAAAPAQPAPASPGGKPAAAPAAGRSGGVGLNQLRLSDVRLVNGAITYLDRKSGARQELSEVNAAVALPGLDEPFRFDGSLVWQKRKVTLVVEADRPRAFIEGGSTPLGVRLATDLATLQLRADTATLPQPKLDGDIDLAVTSIRELAAWTGHPLTLEGSGLGPAAFKGKLAAHGTALSLSDAQLSLDAIKGEGEFAVDTGGTRPSVTAKLALDRLDLNPYLPPEKPAPASKPAGAPAPAAATPGAPAAAPPAASDWSDDPIDVAGLNAADAALDLSLGGLRVRKIEVGKSAVAVRLKDGRLAVEMPELQLYKGEGKGKLSVAPSSPGLVLDAGFQLAGVEAEPLLKDAIDFDRLSGTGTLDFAVTGRGRSQRELIGTLGGKGALEFKDGAVKGINLGVLKGLDLASLQRNLGNLVEGLSSGQTEFASLGGTFTIANGIARNDDLALKSPVLQADGAGTVDLPRRTVDYRVVVKAGVTVPVVIQGPWSHLSYKPDLGGALQQQLSDPGKLLDSLTKGRSGAAPGTAPTAPAPASKSPLDVLRGLGGR